MKKNVLFLKAIFFIIIISIYSNGMDKKSYIVKKEKIINFGNKLENNNLFLKWCISIAHDKDSFYFLDKKLKRVFRVERKTGKLINSISRPGQGPGELQIPSDMRVINERVYILDRGFKGLKIFNIFGKLEKEFKTRGGLGLNPSFDVDKNGHIYVKEVYSEGMFISIYSSSGNFMKKFIKIKSGIKDGETFLKYSYSKLRRDSEGNLYLLFPFLRELWKYNSHGKLLWKVKIVDAILNKYSEDNIRWSGKTVHFSRKIFDFAIDNSRGLLVISHVFGGVVYNKNGHKLFTITFEDKTKALMTVDVFDNSIINGFMGNVEIIKIKEVNNEENQGT